jgi:HD superfamily phosphodiesterase
MLKLYEYFKLDERVYDLFNKVRAELISRDHEEVWKHTLRVIKNLYLISKVYEFKFKTALIAAICHDIGYNEVVEGHEKASSLMMKKELDGMYDNEMVGEIIHCIESHECNKEIKPQTPEAKALHDADMLDYCSERGIINAFLLGNNLGLSESAVSKKIVNAIEEGLLIPALKKKYEKEVKRTEKFFINYTTDLVKEKKDLKEYGMNHA